MKNILVLLWHPVTTSLTAGGFLRAREILKRAPKDTHVDVIDNRPSFLRELENIELHEYNIPGPIRRLEARSLVLGRGLNWLASICLLFLQARQLCHKKRYQAIYLPWGENIVVSLPAILLSRFFRLKVVSAILNIEFSGRTITGLSLAFQKSGYPWLISRFLALGYFGLRSLLVRLYNRMSVIITLSRDLKKDLKRFGVQRRIEIVAAGVDTESIKKIPYQKKLYEGVFIGRHSPEKGIFDLLGVWGLIVKRYPNARLSLVGDCTNRMHQVLNRKITKEKLDRNIVWHGIVSENEKIKILKESKIVIFLSKIEGWGLVSLEGLACGLPVVAYNLPIYQENIKNCSSIFLVPIGDYKAAARKVASLLKEKNLKKYEMAGKKFVRQFDWNEIAEREYQIIIGEE